MVFNLTQNIYFFVSVFCLLWLVILTIILWRTKRHYDKLAKETKKENLTQILEELLNRQKNFEVKLEKLKETIDTVEKKGLGHLQKVGFVRFNPFEDLGGDQSFCLSLLDGKDNGFVLTSLAGRNNTRWYGKAIIAGQGVTGDLSKEEKEALLKASKQEI